MDLKVFTSSLIRDTMPEQGETVVLGCFRSTLAEHSMDELSPQQGWCHLDGRLGG